VSLNKLTTLNSRAQNERQRWKWQLGRKGGLSDSTTPENTETSLRTAHNLAETPWMPPEYRSMVQCHVHKIPPLDSTLNQLTPVHILKPSFRSNLILSSHLLLDLPSGSLIKVYRLKFCVHFTSLLCVLYALPISSPFDLISLMISDEYKLRSYSTCNFLCSPVTSPLGKYI
jgi:hypothetical protein